MTSNAEYAISVLKKFPAIKYSGGVHVDFLGMTPKRYSVRSEPTEQVLKQYLGGASLRRYSFVLEGMAETISDKDRARNAAVFEQLALWLDEQTQARQLPKLANGSRVLRMAAVGGVYLAESADDGDTAVYQMQMEYDFYNEVKRI